MNLIDALKSGKPFKRKSSSTLCWFTGIKESEFYYLTTADLLADDWEVKEEPKPQWLAWLVFEIECVGSLLEHKSATLEYRPANISLAPNAVRVPKFDMPADWQPEGK